MWLFQAQARAQGGHCLFPLPLSHMNNLLLEACGLGRKRTAEGLQLAWTDDHHHDGENLFPNCQLGEPGSPPPSKKLTESTYWAYPKGREDLLN